MTKIKCAAADCEKEFTTNFPHAKYCSDQCRWRESKRKTIKDRVNDGLCPQCGGEMNSSITIHSAAPNYCSKCQSYYQYRYKKSKQEISFNES